MLRELAAQVARPSGDAATRVGDGMTISNKVITGYAQEVLQAATGENIVEIGPGNGQLSRPLVQSLGPDGVYTGIELSEKMAEAAEDVLSRENAAEIRIHARDCQSVSLADQSADGVLAVNVIYFINDLDRFLWMVARWLKPGGRLIIGIRSESVMKKLPTTPHGFIVRPLAEVRDAMLNNGFASVDHAQYDEGIVPMPAFDMEVKVDSLIIRGIRA